MVEDNVPPWITAFLEKVENMFNNMVLNLTLNNILDGKVLGQNVDKYQLGKLSLFI